MTDLKSTNLEKSCSVKGLQFLLDKGLKVVEIVTDAHVQVASIMKKITEIFAIHLTSGMVLKIWERK